MTFEGEEFVVFTHAKTAPNAVESALLNHSTVLRKLLKKLFSPSNDASVSIFSESIERKIMSMGEQESLRA